MKEVSAWLLFSLLCIVESRREFLYPNRLAKYFATKREVLPLREVLPSITSSLGDECKTQCVPVDETKRTLWEINSDEVFKCEVHTKMHGLNGDEAKVMDFCSPNPGTSANGMKCFFGAASCRLGGHSRTSCYVNFAKTGKVPDLHPVPCSKPKGENHDAALKRIKDERLVTQLIAQIMKRDEWRMEDEMEMY